jgi:hypothetical protein
VNLKINLENIKPPSSHQKTTFVMVLTTLASALNFRTLSFSYGKDEELPRSARRPANCGAFRFR